MATEQQLLKAGILVTEDQAFMNSMQALKRQQDAKQFGVDYVRANDAIEQIRQHDHQVLWEQTYLPPIKFTLDKIAGWISGDTIRGYNWVNWYGMSVSLDTVLNHWGDKETEFPNVVKQALGVAV